MTQKQVFKVTKKSDDDYEVIIKPTDNPNDVTIGLVYLLSVIEEHQKKKDPSFRIEGYINEVLAWRKELWQE
ncbi:MAG: hypothetical protein RBR02_06375 [Desulfuromonadaceae bacterium]|nr:hypothetical protein [Desulfuromonadaceae bacterium]